MSNQGKLRREHPSTYFVQDRSNLEELKRLHLQDQMLTRSQGGVLPEQRNPGTFKRILDVGCGTGGWLIAVAKAYPTAEILIGGDVSRTYIEYARTEAEAERVGDQVEFRMLDALRMLEFSTNYFDLVNLRLGSSFMRTWDWLKLLAEMGRVTRFPGTVRVSDLEIDAQSTSPALTQLYERFRCALYRAGHLFTEDPAGLTGHLARLFAQQGYQQVQTQSFDLEYRAGTPEGETCYEDARRIFQTLHPFIHKWGCADSAYDRLYQQMLYEMRQPDFSGTWKMVVTWGIFPGKLVKRPGNR